MQISFHGAARTVTGSQHLIEVNGYRLLLDCGMFQGRRKEANERNRKLPFDAKTIDAMVLSHAHIDHAGNIPSLIKNGYDGPIYATHASRDLSAAMLPDSGHIQEKDAEFVNKKRKQRGEPPIEPIYTQQDAYNSLDNFVGISYQKSQEILEGVHLTLVDAGHMLGSSSVILDIEDKEAGRDIRVVFSGDIGRKGSPILFDPVTVEHADLLIMESTYGGRTHEPTEDIETELAKLVNKVYQQRGVLIIPAFAVGRTQQIVYMLQKLNSSKKIPVMPIYVDSPLAIDATSVFRLHPEAYDADVRDYMLNYGDEDIFGFEKLVYTRRVEESKALNELTGPFIVISASGMCEAGRVLHHLRNRVGDPNNTVLIVGWQAPDTLGRRLIDHISPVRIFGEEHVVRAQVVKMNGLSGHADGNELVDWVRAMKKTPRRTYLVHGELEQANILAERLTTELNLESVRVPDMHEQVHFP
jgi:metallo-beta-lactamase family protein